MDKAFQDLLLEEIRKNRSDIAKVKSDMAKMKLDLSLDMNTMKIRNATVFTIITVLVSTVSSYFYKKFGM